MARAVVKRNDGEIGDVIHAFLSEVDFQAQRHAGWVLADGRDVTGSKYHTVTGNTTIPDVRGLALRAKNNGRSDGNENPDGDLAIGTFQDHSFTSHNHGGGNHGHSLFGRGGSSPTNVGDRVCTSGANASAPDRTIQEMSATGSGTIIANDGGNETRMRNITVNVFIKVNEE